MKLRLFKDGAFDFLRKKCGTTSLKVTSTSIVYATKGNVRAYIMGGCQNAKKRFMVEITQSQTEHYLELTKTLHAEMQSFLGDKFAKVKAWAKERKNELLT